MKTVSEKRRASQQNLSGKKLEKTSILWGEHILLLHIQLSSRVGNQTTSYHERKIICKGMHALKFGPFSASFCKNSTLVFRQIKYQSQLQFYGVYANFLFLQALEFENFTSKGHFTALKLKNIKLSRFAHPQTTLKIQ